MTGIGKTSPGEDGTGIPGVLMLEMTMTGVQPPGRRPAGCPRKAPPTAAPLRQPAEPDTGAASFRERLAARRASRPQSTLAIVSGIRYPAGARQATATTPVRVPEAVPTPRPAAVAHRRAVAAPAGAAVPAGKGKFAVIGGKSGGNGGHGGGADDPAAAAQGGNRLADLSQYAFLGFAVLGLAGLSVLAAESALDRDGPESPGPEGPAGLPGGEASAVAMAAASEADAAPTRPWFDYDALVADIAARKAAHEAEQARAQESARLAVEQEAAAAIAEAEAERLAEEERRAREAEAARLAEAEAEKQRLAELEAERVAAAAAARQAEEAQRQAEAAEAARMAEAAAEKQRLADLEARRVAEAEAARRAEQEAIRAAAEQKRLAAAQAEARRIAALEVERAAEEEARRLAELEARRAADAEARRIAELEAERLARLEAGRMAGSDVQLTSAVAVETPGRTPAQSPERPASPKRTPTPIVFTAHTGPVPAPASLKPERPAVLRAAVSSGTGTILPGEVARPVPETYAAAPPRIRTFEAPATARPEPQTVEDFIAHRVAHNAAAPPDERVMVDVKSAFLKIIYMAPDGSVNEIPLADGRLVSVEVRQTILRRESRPVIRTVSYSASDIHAAPRRVAEVRPAVVPILCREVSYIIQGQEQGQFAACESGKGDWLIARAGDQARPRV